jgi:starvation-inducible outer membrane lipoprotein
MIRIMLTCTLSMLLAACATEPPEDFETGAETVPPIGCVEYRTRGGDC